MSKLVSLSLALIFLMSITLGTVQPENSSYQSIGYLDRYTVRSIQFDADESWWETTSMDMNRNGIHDTLDVLEPNTAINVFLRYDSSPTEGQLNLLQSYDHYLFHEVDAVLVRGIRASQVQYLSGLDGVVMVEPQGELVMLSDVASPNVKARESAEYSPYTAWELNYTGMGVNLAIMDTGIDNGHPSFAGKWVGGCDVTKPESPFTPRDGSFDADDTNGHGTTCAGISTGTGAPEGTYMGAAPDTKLVDLRIGTMVGFSPGEVVQAPPNIYDSSLEGTEWAIQHHADQWEGQTEENWGIDVLSLSWGINVRQSSDGTDVYSEALNRLADTGVIPVVAAGNDGPDNDGFSGMGAADKVITVAATDDLDTITRDDDIIAEYSSRGPRADDGDDNPYDELKPEISAPGTHINQAEYDVIGDGSGNGYGSRGSGTSYATPCIAGIVSLMLQANQNLTPVLTKEILCFTAERKGDATLPDIDPFWNKDFGYGLVDAYKATKLAASITDIDSIDVNLQCHIMNATQVGDFVEISGLAWSRGGSVGSVEVQIDGGSWKLATDLTDGLWNKWAYRVSTSNLGNGNHTVRARAVKEEKTSLTSEMLFDVKGAAKVTEEEGGGMGWLLALLIIPVVWMVYKRKDMLAKVAKKPSKQIQEAKVEPAKTESSS